MAYDSAEDMKETQRSDVEVRREAFQDASVQSLPEAKVQPLLRRLWRLLSQLPMERRRTLLLFRFNERQRQLLERWKLHQPELGKALVMPNRKSAKLDGKAASRSSQRTEGPSMQKALTRKSETPGIMRYYRNKAQTCYYAAHASIGCLQLLTKTERQLEVATRYLAVLLLIRRHTLESKASGAQSFEDCFKQAVAKELSAEEAQAMGLRFVVTIRTLDSSRKLRSPPYRVADIDAGLRAWRLLTEAKAQRQGESVGATGDARWLKMSQAYTKVMEQAGREHMPRLKLLEAELLEHVQKEEQRRKCREDLQRLRSAKVKAKEDRWKRRQEAASSAAQRAEKHIEELLRRWTLAEYGKVGRKQARRQAIPRKA